MENPLNPLENQDPFNNKNPMDDPLLDALEHSMKNPPGFVDSIAECDELIMDDVARQLDQVEASIENAPRIPSEPDVVNDSDEPVGSETPTLPDVFNTPDIEEIPDSEEFGSPQQSAARDSSTNSSGTSQLSPMLHQSGSGGSRRRREFPFRRHSTGCHGSTGARASHNMRICPENHESINEQNCESCEKYRQWPEGTDDESRECWYDWQAQPPDDDSDSDNIIGK